MVELGPGFGLTDNGLKKRFKALGIPGPTMVGYHTMLANGHDTVEVPKFASEFLDTTHTFKGVRADITFEDVMAGEHFQRIQRDIRLDTPPATKMLTRGELHQLLWTQRPEDLVAYLRLSPDYVDKVVRASKVTRPPGAHWKGLKHGAHVARHPLQGDHDEEVLIAPYGLDVQALIKPSNLRFRDTHHTQIVLGLHAQALAEDWFAIPRGSSSVASIAALAEGLRVLGVHQAERHEIIDKIMSLPPTASLRRQLEAVFTNERLHSETTSSLSSFRRYVTKLVRPQRLDQGEDEDDELVGYLDELTDAQRELMVTVFLSGMVRALEKSDWAQARDLTILLMLIEFRLRVREILDIPRGGLDLFRRRITTKAGVTFEMSTIVLCALTRYGQLAPESADGSLFVHTLRGQLQPNTFYRRFRTHRDELGLTPKFTMGSVLRYAREVGKLDNSIWPNAVSV